MMSRFYKNPINDKQMRWNSKNANKIVQMASDAQKAIQNSTVSLVRYLGEFDHNKIDGTMEGDCISEPNGDIYLWCNGKWEIIGNNTYNYNYYTSGRTNGKTMKTAAVQAAAQGIADDNINLISNWHTLALQASAALEKNKGIRIRCTESILRRDPTPVGVSFGAWAQMMSTHIECTLKQYTVIGEDIDFGKVEATAKFLSSDFEDGSYIDKEISIPITLSKKDRYILRIAYVFKQIDKILKGQGDPNNPPKFNLNVRYIW